MNRDFWRAVSAEFLAMFLFVFVCVGAALSTLGIAEGADEKAAPTATLAISFSFGLTIFVLAHCFGHISGAHINPAVTVTLMISGRVDPVKGVFYIVAQCCGSIASSGILMVVMGLEPETMGGWNSLAKGNHNTILQAFVGELILTFLLCFTVMATIDPSRDANLGPLAIGMAVCVSHIILVPITGCGINPARSLGPALFSIPQSGAIKDLWVFLVAPLLASPLAAMLYPLWFEQAPVEQAPVERLTSAAQRLTSTRASPAAEGHDLGTSLQQPFAVTES